MAFRSSFVDAADAKLDGAETITSGNLGFGLQELRPIIASIRAGLRVSRRPARGLARRSAPPGYCS
jgi:hypothetical protein